MSNERSRLIAAIPGSDYGSRQDPDEDVQNMTSLTVNRPSGSEGRKVTQYIAALAATGGALAAGTVLGWTSPTQIPLVENQEYGFPITTDQFSWIGSAINLGAAAICLPIGTIMNLIGRKLTMLLMVLPFTVGWALIIWAQNVGMMITGRALVGIAGGAFCVTSPIYIGEIAQKEIRGALGSYFQLMITIGILFVYAVGVGVDVFWLSIICGIIPLVFGVIFSLMPESPTYLVMKDKNENALKSLEWLRGKEYDSTSELSELKEEIDQQKSLNVSIGEALSRPATVKALIISIGLMFFQQLSGINAVIFYTTDIFNAASSQIAPEVATIIIGVMQVVATFIATLVVDKLGRRILLLASVGVMAICTILLGLYFFLAERDPANVENISWLPIVSLCFFIVMFSIGFGPVPWLMVGELFAPDVKSIAGPAAGTTNWLLAFIVTKTFNNLRAAMGIGPTFWLFSAISLVGVAFVFFIVPETKGKSLSDIQKMLAGEKVDEPVEQK